MCFYRIDANIFYTAFNPADKIDYIIDLVMSNIDT